MVHQGDGRQLMLKAGPDGPEIDRQTQILCSAALKGLGLRRALHIQNGLRPADGHQPGRVNVGRDLVAANSW